jgi:prepilin-type N-terminal cleavage/methylation domain-containing protein/prepilin-type processing-associated H-X9-DG protein
MDFGAKIHQQAFTLIELLVAIAIIAILAALLLPALSSAKQRAWMIACASNLHQISLGMTLFADDHQGLYPESGGIIPWDANDFAPPAGSGKPGWMEQLISYTQNTNIYHCPGNAQLPAANQSPFNYFNGARAAYIAAGGFAPVDVKRIRFPTAYVLSGDTIDNGQYFGQNDSDKDDYTQNCVGGPANGTPWVDWPAHSKGQNILFADGHAKWYNGYNTNEMAFRYDSMHGWE